jgi:hypothetical protein
MAPSGTLALDDPLWGELHHAYGLASDLPDLLRWAQDDSRPGYDDTSAWFRLWSALCHQDNIYTASYAAVPHLISISRDHKDWADPLLLAACIEVVRLEGGGPEMPASLSGAYEAAIIDARVLADQALQRASDDYWRRAFTGVLAAFTGDAAVARANIDPATD